MQVFLADLIYPTACLPWVFVFVRAPPLETASLLVTLSKLLRRSYTRLPGNVSQLRALVDASGTIRLPRGPCRTSCGLLTVVRRLLGPHVSGLMSITGLAALEADRPAAPGATPGGGSGGGDSGSDSSSGGSGNGGSDGSGNQEVVARERLRKVLSVCVTTLLSEVAEAVRRVGLVYEVEPFAVSGDGLLDG